MESIREKVISFLLSIGFGEGISDELASVILLVALVSVAFVIRYFVRRILVSWINSLFLKSKNKFDDILIEHKVFHKLTHFIPAFLLIYGIPYIIETDDIKNFLLAVFRIYLVLVSIIAISTTISALHDMYKKLPVAENVQIMGYVQVVKILVHIVGGVLVLSVLLNQSPYALLTSLGAMAAILMLVFRDTILGFVANVQLSANNMVKPGDWITVGTKADGTVLDITLTTVKIQNFDKTIVMLPTSHLVSDSFVNWRGMEEAGGRRIKRSITILSDSVEFLREEHVNNIADIEHFVPVVREYRKSVEEKPAEQRLTNLGLFRQYIEFYLKRHPLLHNDLTFLVRHLPNDGNGIPIEIYFFSKDQSWVGVENLQAEVFEHFYAIVPKFGLKVFQRINSHHFLG